MHHQVIVRPPKGTITFIIDIFQGIHIGHSLFFGLVASILKNVRLKIFLLGNFFRPNISNTPNEPNEPNEPNLLKIYRYYRIYRKYIDIIEYIPKIYRK